MCQYVTQNGIACTAKKLVNGILCKRHMNTKRARIQCGMEKEEEPVVAPKTIKIKIKKNKTKSSDDDESSEPLFKVKDIKVKKEEKKSTKKKKSTFLDDIEAEIPDLNDTDNVDDAFENIMDETQVIDERKRDKDVEVLEYEGSDNDQASEYDEFNSGEQSQGYESDSSETKVVKKKKSKVSKVANEKIVKIGYFTLLNIAEKQCNPYLNGLVAECVQDEDIHECLRELSEEFEDMLGISDLDPSIKLLLLTGIVCAKKYTDNTCIKTKPITEPTVTVHELPQEFHDL